MFLYKLLALVVLSSGLLFTNVSGSSEIVDPSVKTTHKAFKIYESKEMTSVDLYAYAGEISSGSDDYYLA